jgi:hypothetical protein
VKTTPAPTNETIAPVSAELVAIDMYEAVATGKHESLKPAPVPRFQCFE